MNYTELELPKAGDTVVVGLSGGVDSTVTAMLLKERGCRVIGVTMSLWTDGDLKGIDNAALAKHLHDSCYGPGEKQDIADCKEFCKENDIEYKVIDVKDAYKTQVLEYFKNEYRSGRTPNPCIRCNRFIKFGALLSGIEAIGIDYDYFCTGHYAKIVKPQGSIASCFGATTSADKTGAQKPEMIATAEDSSKDQTYFLYRIPSSILEKVRFPLYGYKKSEVFKMAKELNLKAAQKEESQDFIPPEYFDSLFSDQASVPGDFIDLDGKVLGRHKGIEHYTVGQRRGLGISAKEPLYVASIDKEKNVIVLGRDSDLFSTGLIAEDMSWPANYDPNCAFEANVKIRLASKPVKALIEPFIGEDTNGKSYKVTFEEPQRAVAPGQSIVFYREGVIYGGGIITKSLHGKA